MLLQIFAFVFEIISAAMGDRDLFIRVLHLVTLEHKLTGDNT